MTRSVVAGVASLADPARGVTVVVASLADAGVVSLADAGVASLADAGVASLADAGGGVPGRSCWQCCQRSDGLGCTGSCENRINDVTT